MLYEITHLKAPWPLGAVVGDVVDLPEVPVWGAGKCKPAADGAEATVGEPLPAIDGDKPAKKVK